MQCSIKLLLPLLLVASTLHGRIWTDQLDRRIEASFISATETTATIKRESDSQTFEIPISSLSPRDQSFVADQLMMISKQTNRPDEDAFFKYQDKLKAFQLGSKNFKARYLGTKAVQDEPIGKIRNYPNSFSLLADGRLAIARGSGTVARMSLNYWDTSGIETEILPLTYEPSPKGLSKEDKEKREKDGKLWFYGGQIAAGKNDQLYTTLGACCDNGILKIKDTSLERLNYTISSSSFQIPDWDQRHGYIGRVHEIRKYRLKKSPEAFENGEVYFSVSGDTLYINHSLMLSDSQLVVCLSYDSGELNERDRKIFTSFTLLIDKDKGGYYLIKEGSLGPMTISQDGSRMLRYDSEQQMLCEFKLID